MTAESPIFTTTDQDPPKPLSELNIADATKRYIGAYIDPRFKISASYDHPDDDIVYINIPFQNRLSFAAIIELPEQVIAKNDQRLFQLELRRVVAQIRKEAPFLLNREELADYGEMHARNVLHNLINNTKEN